MMKAQAKSRGGRTQHRPRRENKEVSMKEYAELKAENHRLKREVARLTKFQQQQKAMYESFLEGKEEEAMEEKITESVVEKEKAACCPQCGSEDFRLFFLGLKFFNVCADCLFREPSKES